MLTSIIQRFLLITSALGKPSALITISSNPNWPEVIEQLNHNEKSNKIPDFIPRVFLIKKINAILKTF